MDCCQAMKSNETKPLMECGTAGMYKSCRHERRAFSDQHGRSYCPWDRYVKDLDDFGIPEREKRLILAYKAGEALLLTVAVQAALSLMGREPGPHGMRGTESLVILGGQRGVGKTVGACLALSVFGGRYLTSYRLARPGINLESLYGLGLLVVDQLGCEAIGRSDYMIAQLEEVVDARYANTRPTILIGNLTREAFVSRYGRIIEDRLDGDGVFIRCTGESLRGRHE